MGRGKNPTRKVKGKLILNALIGLLAYCVGQNVVDDDGGTKVPYFARNERTNSLSELKKRKFEQVKDKTTPGGGGSGCM